MKYESKSSVVDHVLSESRCTRTALKRWSYVTCAIGVGSGTQLIGSHQMFATKTSSSPEFVLGVEHGFEGYLLKDMTTVADKVLAARADYRQGRATGSEIWKRRGEGHKS